MTTRIFGNLTQAYLPLYILETQHFDKVRFLSSYLIFPAEILNFWVYNFFVLFFSNSLRLYQWLFTLVVLLRRPFLVSNV